MLGRPWQNGRGSQNILGELLELSQPCTGVCQWIGRLEQFRTLIDSSTQPFRVSFRWDAWARAL